MGAGRVVAALAIVGGLGLISLGVAGLANAGPLAMTATAVPSAGAMLPAPTPPSGGPSPVGPAPTPAASPTAAAEQTLAPPSVAPSPTADPLAQVQALYARLVPAVRSADAGTLLALLHPATIERYGETACRATFSSLQDPAFDIVPRSVGSPGPWNWERDGRSTTIPDAWPIQVDLTSQGATSSTEVHVAPVGGELRWFTDCGTPIGG